MNSRENSIIETLRADEAKRQIFALEEQRDKLLATNEQLYAEIERVSRINELSIEGMTQQIVNLRTELSDLTEKLEHASSLCESVSLWNADEITDSELSNGLTQWLLFLGDLKECVGCGEIMETAASVVIMPGGHKSYLCGECFRDGDHSWSNFE